MENPTMESPDFSKGLVPAIAQDADTGEVLMVAFMNDIAWEETLKTRHAVYWSRRRGLWRKGEESGNFQEVVEIRIDCDLDTILLRVRQHGGAACHTGFRSCFHRVLDGDGWQVDGEPLFDPAKVYGKESR
ncbi:MAG: phosphoribosyl-AMP cyclohydrolase [Alphaproteobacteria bacterium]